ncbi:MAG: hypothetical protein QM779_14690 [Propionicimonas sp.]|uniref:ATP-binding protein n=1 Tax=Propionicimonas sp. TaxID=1955623 RepID=UPI003D0D5CD8
MSLDLGSLAWREGPPTAASEAAETISRQIAWIFSLVYGLLELIGLVGEVPSVTDTPAGWQAASLLVALGTVAILVGTRAPRAVLRAGWAIYPVGWALSAIAWTVLGPSQVPGASLMPWTWDLAPLAIAIAALRWSLVPAVAIGIAPILVVLAVAVSGGVLTPGLASMIALGLGNSIFAVLVVAARSHLLQTWHAARRLADEERAALLEQAWRAERDRLTALIHDQVLGTLSAVGRGGVGHADLVAAAENSLELLADHLTVTDESLVIRDDLRAVALANRFDFTLAAPAAEVRYPGEVGEAVIAATAQAARNSVEHAGTAAARTMRVDLAPASVVVEVVDDGVGFDPDAVPETRLGLQTSVLGRMRALDGGDAVVGSAPGEGTTVRISWRAADRKPAQRTPSPVALPLPDIGTATGVTSRAARVCLLLCWGAGLAWVAQSWPSLPAPALTVAAVAWLLIALFMVTRPSTTLPGAPTVVVAALTPAVTAACLLVQWTQVLPEQVWLLQLGADVGALLALRGRVRAGAAGILLSVAVVLPMTLGMGQVGAGVAVLVSPVVAVIAASLLYRVVSRTMTATLAARDAEAQAIAAQHAARDAAERARGLRVEVARLSLPSLTAVVAGEAVDAGLAESCLIAAASVRDLLRAPALATGSLARICADARDRGVRVRLLDDSSGLRPLSEATIRRLAEAVAAAAGGRVTIRVQPDGRRPAVTLVLDDATVTRLEFDE